MKHCQLKKSLDPSVKWTVDNGTMDNGTVDMENKTCTWKQIRTWTQHRWVKFVTLKKALISNSN